MYSIYIYTNYLFLYHRNFYISLENNTSCTKNFKTRPTLKKMYGE